MNLWYRFCVAMDTYKYSYGGVTREEARRHAEFLNEDKNKFNTGGNKMKKIIIYSEPMQNIALKDVPEDTPIFVKQHGKLVGMLVEIDDMWLMVSVSVDKVVVGLHSRQEAIAYYTNRNYECVIED